MKVRLLFKWYLYYKPCVNNTYGKIWFLFSCISLLSSATSIFIDSFCSCMTNDSSDQNVENQIISTSKVSNDEPELIKIVRERVYNPSQPFIRLNEPVIFNHKYYETELANLLENTRSNAMIIAKYHSYRHFLENITLQPGINPLNIPVGLTNIPSYVGHGFIQMSQGNTTTAVNLGQTLGGVPVMLATTYTVDDLLFNTLSQQLPALTVQASLSLPSSLPIPSMPQPQQLPTTVLGTQSLSSSLTIPTAIPEDSLLSSDAPQPPITVQPPIIPLLPTINQQLPEPVPVTATLLLTFPGYSNLFSFNNDSITAINEHPNNNNLDTNVINDQTHNNIMGTNNLEDQPNNNNINNNNAYQDPINTMPLSKILKSITGKYVISFQSRYVAITENDLTDLVNLTFKQLITQNKTPNEIPLIQYLMLCHNEVKNYPHTALASILQIVPTASVWMEHSRDEVALKHDIRQSWEIFMQSLTSVPPEIQQAFFKALEDTKNDLIREMPKLSFVGGKTNFDIWLNHERLVNVCQHLLKDRINYGKVLEYNYSKFSFEFGSLISQTYHLSYDLMRVVDIWYQILDNYTMWSYNEKLFILQLLSYKCHENMIDELREALDKKTLNDLQKLPSPPLGNTLTNDALAVTVNNNNNNQSPMPLVPVTLSNNNQPPMSLVPVTVNNNNQLSTPTVNASVVSNNNNALFIANNLIYKHPACFIDIRSVNPNLPPEEDNPLVMAPVFLPLRISSMEWDMIWRSFKIDDLNYRELDNIYHIYVKNSIRDTTVLAARKDVIFTKITPEAYSLQSPTFQEYFFNFLKDRLDLQHAVFNNEEIQTFVDRQNDVNHMLSELNMIVQGNTNIEDKVFKLKLNDYNEKRNAYEQELALKPNWFKYLVYKQVNTNTGLKPNNLLVDNLASNVLNANDLPRSLIVKKQIVEQLERNDKLITVFETKRVFEDSEDTKHEEVSKLGDDQTQTYLLLGVGGIALAVAIAYSFIFR